MYPYIFMIMISGCIYFFAEYFTRSFKVLSNLVYILVFFVIGLLWDQRILCGYRFIHLRE